MHLTRRQFVFGSAVGLGALASPALARVPTSAPPAGKEIYLDPTFWTLNRIAYGPTPFEEESLRRMGLKHYLEQQLHPDNASDTLCNNKLSKAVLAIEYKASDPKSNEKATGSYPAVKEDRPLLALGSPLSDLWKLADYSVRIDNKERNRPTEEVRAATWIRAVYSQWQLREVMVEFWHNHFNVHAFSTAAISGTFPLYDGIMRKHCFGNFRAFLEDVAQSAAMQYYLNNNRSKASPANENYARELFELHTLGADHYYNDLYNRWREVPGAVKGHPIGYIDQDVYEAARAFTGWTIEDGSNTGKGTTFPKTGKFVYFDGWHDNYQKRVLGTEFDPNSPPMADGRKVLDLVSAHPGTAMYLCTKLCRRLVADTPPKSLVVKAAKTWQKNIKSEDQIKQVLRTIILSPEFAASQGKKVKRPFEFAASFLRATGADFAPNSGLFYEMSNAGYRQFEWATPTGHPDTSEYWLNSNTTLTCWNLLPKFFSDGFKVAQFDLAAHTPDNVRTSGDIINHWVRRLAGKQPDDTLFVALMQYMPNPKDPNFIPDIHHSDFKEPLQQMVMAIGMLPDFQVR